MRQTIIAVCVALVAVIFAVQNSDDQLLTIFFWEIKMPLSLLIIFTLIIGLIAGMLIMTKPYLDKRKLANDLQKQIQDVTDKTSK